MKSATAQQLSLRVAKICSVVATLLVFGFTSSSDARAQISDSAAPAESRDKGIPVPFCGDGIVNNDEECDPNVIIGSVETCCTSDCKIAAAGVECRAGNGICDPAEVCSGTSIACPLNQLAPAGTDCDNDDLFCNGTAMCDGAGACNPLFIKCSFDSPVCDEDYDGCVGLCGDGFIGVLEDCDDGNTDTETCAYGTESCSVCGDACVTVASSGPFCGDGVVQDLEGESCDDGAVNGTPGNCNATCDGHVPIGESCGNGTVETGEVCDDGDTNGTVEGGCAANCGGLLVVCYADEDGDGFGAADAIEQLELISCPIGLSADNSDCNDNPGDVCAAASFPGGDELCDGCDNDCDAQTPDAHDEVGIGEICRDGVSGSCRTGTLLCDNGTLGCSCDATLNCFVDTDGDEFGTTPVVVSAEGGAISCLDVPGFADVDGDCDPDEALCTTACEDVDGDNVFDCADDCLDADGDGYGEGSSCVASDCDDTQSTCTDNCEVQVGAGTPCDGSAGDATDDADSEDALDDAIDDVDDDGSDDASQGDAGGDTSTTDGSSDDATDTSNPGSTPDVVVSGGSGNGCTSVGTRTPRTSTSMVLFALGLMLVRRRRR